MFRYRCALGNLVGIGKFSRVFGDMSIRKCEFVVVFVINGTKKTASTAEIESTDFHDIDVLRKVVCHVNARFQLKIQRIVTSPPINAVSFHREVSCFTINNNSVIGKKFDDVIFINNREGLQFSIVEVSNNAEVAILEVLSKDVLARSLEGKVFLVESEEVVGVENNTVCFEGRYEVQWVVRWSISEVHFER